MSRLRLALATLATLATLAAAPAPAPRVAVTGGAIEGVAADDGSLIFRGIPFAGPPLGSARWTAPKAVVPWTGVRPARTMAPSCPQNDHGWNTADVGVADENCLTLDVRTPALTGKRPVMVWIHGGSNRAGSARGMVDSTLTQRGVVLVAIQYRLGILGFLSPRGAAVKGRAGNYGLMDQIAALRWVRGNIARFGGDPAQVTIFGESAGAQDVSLLLAAPAARPLFGRAIMQSGTPGFGQPFRPLSDAFRIGDQAERLGGGLAGLRAMPVSGLLAIDRRLADPTIHSNDFLWLRTTIDGDVLPASPRDLLVHAPRKPVIIGSNRAEFGPAAGGDVPAMLAQVYGARARDAARLYAFERPGRDPRLGHPELEIMTDRVFRCPAVTLAGLLVRQGWPVWTYEFDLSPTGGFTSHAAEIPYVTDRRAIAPGVSLQDYWTSFAKRGDPNDAGLPVWPAHGEAGRYLAIGPKGVQAGTGLRREICALRSDI